LLYLIDKDQMIYAGRAYNFFFPAEKGPLNPAFTPALWRLRGLYVTPMDTA